MNSKIPKNHFAKSKVIGKATLKIGIAKSKSLVKRKFLSSSKKEQEKKENNEKIAEIIMEALGEIKGVSVKIAQQIGLNLTFLPEEFITKLEQSFNQIPPLNRAVVRKVIKSEFNAYPHELFNSFDSEVFAAASLGQVHQATLDDECVVVKIQYPSIEDSIKNDMKVMRFVLQKASKSKQIDHLVSEIADRLYEEIDYELEANNQNYFASHLHNPSIIIPKVYKKYSSSKVLTSQKLEGIILRDFLASNPTQKERNYYANLLFQSFFDSLYSLHTIHADPNPGNYLFMADGKLGMIDFGCIKRVDKEFLTLYSKLHLALVGRKDEAMIMEFYYQLGMIEQDESETMKEFYYKVLYPLDSLYIEPFIEGKFDFKKHHDFSKRGFEALMSIQKDNGYEMDKLNQEFIFLDRTLLGLYAIFEKLGAVVDTSYAIELMRREI
ncbi:MAG: AarF/ABC1/UbiB kinase family protein [Campylobacterota bacterium]|nr:AarF/ABC1/UbiB kinase family protein [Campylobacterota bacterium]